MPLYDYQCSACGSVFEAEHAMSARPKLKCNACGSTRTSKLFNAAGVQFRGSGFYVTDSRGSGGEKVESASAVPAPCKPEGCACAAAAGKSAEA